MDALFLVAVGAKLNYWLHLQATLHDCFVPMLIGRVGVFLLSSGISYIKSLYIQDDFPPTALRPLPKYFLMSKPFGKEQQCIPKQAPFAVDARASPPSNSFYLQIGLLYKANYIEAARGSSSLCRGVCAKAWDVLYNVASSLGVAILLPLYNETKRFTA